MVRVKTEASFHMGRHATAREVAEGLRWLAERAQDSDRPVCTFHAHEDDQPCTSGCANVAADGTLTPLKEGK